jgi:hypothetical protein
MASLVGATGFSALAWWGQRWLVGTRKPFHPLIAHRLVGRPELPPDLSQFYSKHEGVGLESSPDRSVRLARLSEVTTFAWQDIPIFGAERLTGWDHFKGWQIGIGTFLDRIFWVERAPCCDIGAILTIGPDVAGPGGKGSHPLEPSLVLASSFSAWIAHLERCNWLEYGLTPGEIEETSEFRRSELRTYYFNLNPGISWGSA